MQWIQVTDRLPEKPGMYLCHFSDGETETFSLRDDEMAQWDEDQQFWGIPAYPQHDRPALAVTHWMELPEPPDA